MNVNHTSPSLTKLFGTSGIRGDSQTLFTGEFCQDIGRTFDLFLSRHGQEGAVAIGMDPRDSSPRIKKDFAIGVGRQGREIIDLGVLPVPAVCLMAQGHIAGSTMITGSHIAAHLNGLKFFVNTEEIVKNEEREIEEIYTNLSPSTPPSSLPQPALSDIGKTTYMNFLERLLRKPVSKQKIIVDCANGAQSETLPLFLSSMGFEVIKLNCHIQGQFIARDTESDGNATDLQSEVVKEGADLGMAFDPDGDRVVFVDSLGRFVPGDYSGALLSRADTHTKDVVTPINTSQVIDNIGKTVHRTRVGSPYVIEKMKEIGIDFGFEANGGCIFAKSMYTRDSGHTVVAMLNLLTLSREPLHALYDSLPRFYQFRTKVNCQTRFNTSIIKRAKKEFKGKIETLDGLKIWVGEKEWILLRPSGNAPEFRIFSESPDEAHATKLGNRALSFVNSVIASL